MTEEFFSDLYWVAGHRILEQFRLEGISGGLLYPDSQSRACFDQIFAGCCSASLE